MKKYLPRVSDEIIQKYLKSQGAILIEGPKWCGKTTSAKQFSKSSVFFGLQISLKWRNSKII